jgi:hypothetical protein
VKKARKSVHTVKAFYKTPREWTLKEIIFHNFSKKDVFDEEIIHEFCEIQYGPLWDVLINFEAFCFDHPEVYLPQRIDQFLEKKMR